MKFDFRFLSIGYCLAFIFFILFFLLSITECEAYWTHDASIVITHKWLISNCSYLFLPPVIILFINRLLKIKIPVKLFVAHFFISLTSISLLAIAIDKPCDYINGGHYKFIDSFMTLGHYLFKFMSYIIICFIIIISFISIVKQK